MTTNKGLREYFLKNFHDEKFYRNKNKYLLQCSLLTLVMFATLFAINIMPNTAVIASIGASTFTIFVFPHRELSQEHIVISGYIIGFTVGTLCYLLLHYISQTDSPIAFYYDEICGALAVGLTTFLMVVFNAEHPPACAVALALVIDTWSLSAIMVTSIAVLFVLAYRHLFRRYMIDLL